MRQYHFKIPLWEDFLQDNFFTFSDVYKEQMLDVKATQIEMQTHWTISLLESDYYIDSSVIK